MLENLDVLEVLRLELLVFLLQQGDLLSLEGNRCLLTLNPAMHGRISFNKVAFYVIFGTKSLGTRFLWSRSHCLWLFVWLLVMARC